MPTKLNVLVKHLKTIFNMNELQGALNAKIEAERAIKNIIIAYERVHGLKVVNVSHVRSTLGDGTLLNHRVELNITL